MRYSPLFSALAALLLAACSQEQISTCGDDSVVASQAWARATRPGQPMSAAYVTLCNGAPTPDRLLAVKFEGAAAAELHATTTSETNVAKMAPLEAGLPLPAGEVVEMAPGGAHIMLINLSGPIAQGDEPAITLEFEHAPPLTLTLEVRSLTEGDGHSGH